MNIIRKIICSLLLCVGAASAEALILSSRTGIAIGDKGKVITSDGQLKEGRAIGVYGLTESFSLAHSADTLATYPAEGYAALQVQCAIGSQPCALGEIADGDTAKIVFYHHCTSFRTKPDEAKIVIKKEGEEFKITVQLEDCMEGAPIYNMSGKLIAMASADTAGKVCVAKPIAEVLKNDLGLINNGAINARVCMIVVYDEAVNLGQGGATEATVKKQTKEEKEKAMQDNIGIEMVSVEGGTFIMGCDGGYADCSKDEKPAHEVTVGSFKIMKYEVTQKLWTMVMKTNPSPVKGDNMPVYNVSFIEVIEFIEKLNEQCGTHFRLPTEAEWEFAAKGGTKGMGYKYSGADELEEVAWFRDNAGGKPHPVGTKKPNELGIYDMCGNVAEWCADDFMHYAAPDYIPYYYNTGTDTFDVYRIKEHQKLKNQFTNGRRVMRGSGFFYEKGRCNLSYRRAVAITDKYTFGFRMAE